MRVDVDYKKNALRGDSLRRATVVVTLFFPSHAGI